MYTDCSQQPIDFSEKSYSRKVCSLAMSVTQQSLEQQADGHNKEAGGDAANYSSDPSSSCSTPSRSCNEYSADSDGPYYSSDFEDQADSVKNKTPEAQLLNKSKGSQATKRKKVKRANNVVQQKTNCTTNCKVLKLPPIKPLQGPKQRIQSAHMHRIKELSSQVWDLQHQLSGATTENKLLKRLQHRHTVALQHFQDSENSLPQVLAKHSNEVQALQELLRSTRICRNSLARQLRDTDNELIHTKETLQHLQLLSQDRSLLEREELTHRLAETTAELARKKKRIQDLEKNLELCQGSFNRQIVTEIKKTNEATKISTYLQEQINQLTQKIKERERELEMHNIYSHRFSKGGNKKDIENKMVQTDGPFPLPIEDAGHLRLEYSKPEEWHEGHQSFEHLAIEYPDIGGLPADKSEDDDDPEDTEKCADSEPSHSSDGSEPQAERESAKEMEVAGGQQTLERGQIESCESLVPHTLKKSLRTAQPQHKGLGLPGIRRHYTFKQTIQNLHSGKPAYSSLMRNPYESIKDQMRMGGLSSGACDPPLIGLQARKSLSCEVTSPLCEERAVQNKKISLMSDLFGPNQMTTLVSGDGGLGESSSDMEGRLSSCHSSEISSIFFD